MLFASFALAGAPTAAVLPSQAVEGSVTVNLTPADALSRLADPTWVRSIDGGGTTVSVRTRDGSCLIADYTSPSVVMTVRYTIRQCPTGHGYKATLVSSDDFDSYESEWSVTPDGAGSLLTYRVRIDPSMPLPSSLITGTMRKEVQGMMERFAARLGTP